MPLLGAGQQCLGELQQLGAIGEAQLSGQVSPCVVVDLLDGGKRVAHSIQAVALGGDGIVCFFLGRGDFDFHVDAGGNFLYITEVVFFEGLLRLGLEHLFRRRHRGGRCRWRLFAHAE